VRALIHRLARRHEARQAAEASARDADARALFRVVAEKRQRRESDGRMLFQDVARRRSRTPAETPGSVGGGEDALAEAIHSAPAAGEPLARVHRFVPSRPRLGLRLPSPRLPAARFGIVAGLGPPRVRITKTRLSLAGALAVGLTVGAGVFAYWTSSGTGSAGATVTGLDDPEVTATAVFNQADISWTAVSAPTPTLDPEITFTVERKPSAGVTWVHVCGTGTTPKEYDELSCSDQPPSTGDYDYRVTAHFRSWTSSGVDSVHVIVDTIPPTSTITFPGSGPYNAAAWDAGCSSSICGTASDTGGSGLQEVEVSIRRASGNYWNGSTSMFDSASQVWNLATGTSTWDYAFPSTNFPADDEYTVEVRATDNASNVQSPTTTRTFDLDTTAPVVDASVIAATTGTNPEGFVKQGGTYRVFANVSDATALASVTADVSFITAGETSVALTACGGCGSGGSYAYRSAELTADGTLAQGTAGYTVAATDAAANTSAPAPFDVQVDNTGPQVTTVITATTGTSPQGFVKQAGTYRVYANVSDLPAGPGASSGVDETTITADVSAVSAGQSAAALSACGSCGPGGAYAYQSANLTADNPLAEGSKTYSVSANDNLGTTGTSSGASVQVDNSAPTVATVVANTATDTVGVVAQNSGYRVYANVDDQPTSPGTFSGLNTASITADVSNVTSGQTAVPLTTAGCPCTIGSTTYTYRSSVLTSSNPLSEGAKSFSTSASDNLGTSTTQGGSVTVDNTAPAPVAVRAREMFDVDLDGKVDQVKVTFTETLATPYTAPASVWVPANAPGGPGNTVASAAVSGMVATITFNEGVVNTAAGTFTIALTANAGGVRDLAGNQSSFAAAAVADKAQPIPANTVMNNAGGGGTAVGRADSGDTVVVTYSEQIDATSFCSTWTNSGSQVLGAGTNMEVDILITDNAANDVLTIADVGGTGGSNCGGSTSFKFGSIALGANYVTGNVTFSGNGTANRSVLTWNPTAKTLTIRLGTVQGPGTVNSSVAASTPSFTPSTSLKDLASPANNAPNAAFSATGTSRF
jgi:hypothetical protein